jgi:Protein of unknown function (DUF2878)
MSQVSTMDTRHEASGASVIVNFIAFQIGWFACVLGAAWGLPWTGTAIAAAVVALHLWRVARPGQELKLIAAALAIGLAWDSLLVNLGLVSFESDFPLEYAAPQWILALWALFATTLNVSLRWLQGRWLVAALLGVAAGPLSYWAGMRLGALVLPELLPALLALAVGWGAMTPLLLFLARRFNGVNATR